MPTVTISFDSIEEAEELHEALNAGKYLAMLHDIRDKIRQVNKYGPDFTFDQFVEWLRENEFYEIVE